MGLELDGPSLEGIKLKKLKKIKKKRKAKRDAVAQADPPRPPRERNAIEKAKASKLLQDSKEKELKHKNLYGSWFD